jgi:RNA polymerase sigma-70 factor, ECF subfamily
VNATDTFTALRPLLFGVAYRMLGSVTEAEDAVQDAYLRWSAVDAETIESPKAFLTTVVTRLCLDRLKSARVQREVYVGEWLPEPLVDDASVRPDAGPQLADSLSMAFLVLLEKLSPPERAAFLLREVFDFDYAEVAAALGRNEPACRQLVTRARMRLRRDEGRFRGSPDQEAALRDRFMAAANGSDLPGLVSLLADDAAVYTDHGGKAAAARRTIRGADKVARFFIGVTDKFLAEGSLVEPRSVNGRPGLVVFESGRAVTALSVEAADGKVSAVYIVRNPEKLAHIRPLAVGGSANVN